uniref:NP n=2 Tax=root TaxID=1 RepID=A0A1Y1K087_PHOPY|nr:NP [Photinus pyralis orthomyxo-like virus 1]
MATGRQGTFRSDKDEQMDLDTAGPSGTKRAIQDILVDPDDNTVKIPSAKKPRVELNTIMKKNVLLFLTDSFIRLMREVTPLPEAISNLTLGIQIGNILNATHNILRQGAAGKYTALETKTKDQGFSIAYNGTHVIALDRAKAIVGECAKRQSLTYKDFSPKDVDAWYGTAGPYINFMCGFGLRLKELRLGHNSMPITKENGVRSAFPVSSYGLEGSHHILLEGCTFPPEKRSSIVQSLGPMTVLLCYMKAEGKYASKWKTACKRAFAHIPFIDDILNAIHGKQASETRTIIKTMANISRIITTRQATRAFLPFNLVSLLLWSGVKDGPLETIKIAGVVNKHFTLQPGPKWAERIDFSGMGALMAYTTCMKGYEWHLQTQMNSHESGQVVFHSIFGTYKEDLGILEKITNFKTSWSRREDLKDKFQQPHERGTLVPCHPIQFELWSKLSSASQTGLLSTSFMQDSSLPCFSGTRKVRHLGAFLENMKRKNDATSGGKTLPLLATMLSDVLSGLIQDLEKDGLNMDMGTTHWFVVKDLKFDGEAPAPCNFIAETTGKFFLGPKP